MEKQVAAGRRMNLIAAHFVPTTDPEFSPTHSILPMNCSSSLNSAIPRYDNRMYFARQGSSSQGCFMRHAQEEVSTDKPLKASLASSPTVPPMFSRPGTIQQYCNLLATHQPAPMFAKPSPYTTKIQQPSHAASQGTEWCPKMDVAEAGPNYVVTVELSGVTPDAIRVEINGQELIVRGKRWTGSSIISPPAAAYHKREILQGPYQVVWRLPSNANKHSVSALFRDGFLQITIPKL